MNRIDALRERHGGIHPGAAKKKRDFLEPIVQGFIRHSPFAVLSTSDAEGRCDSSPRGGKPGFVQVLDERTLLVPDIGGNRLFDSYSNFESNLRAGLLFMIPGTDVTARVNGRTEVLDEAAIRARGVAPELHWQDHNSILVQGFLLHVEEAYLHCPRSFQFADLWNTETIAANRQRALKDLL